MSVGYLAKELGKTEKGNSYGIIQDSPSTFHITVSIGNNMIYDLMASPSSMDEIKHKITEMETELISTIPI